MNRAYIDKWEFVCRSAKRQADRVYRRANFFKQRSVHEFWRQGFQFTCEIICQFWLCQDFCSRGEKFASTALVLISRARNQPPKLIKCAIFFVPQIDHRLFDIGLGRD